MTVALAVSLVNSLVFHSACIGGMKAPCFSDFLAQTRLNLDTDEEVIFLYDGAPELRMLPAYSPFLKIVEQAIGLLKGEIKRDVSRPETQARMDDRAEIRRLRIQLEEMRARLLPDAPRRWIGVITAAKANK